MAKQKWDCKMVAAQIEEAAGTLGRLPEEKLRGVKSNWPEPLPAREDYRWENTKVRLGPPSPDAIDRMDETMGWLRWLEPDQAKLVWARAERIPWKLIMRQLGVCRETARQRWMAALVNIASCLNHNVKSNA
jgi:hypothetical protein